jgi:hypothetical protein
MKFLKALVVALVISHGAHAEGVTPYRTSAVKKTSKRSRHSVASLSKDQVAGNIPTMTFTTRLHTEGNVRISFNVQKAAHWSATISKDGREYVDPQSLELYQGEVAIRGVRYPAAASVVGKNIVLSFPGRTRGSRASRQRIFTLTTPVVTEGRSAVRVASSPASVFHNKVCGHDHSKEGVRSHSAMIEPLNAGMKEAKLYHVLTLSTVADPQLYAQYGKDTNAYIAGIVNAAEVLFEKSLGIRFQIVKQHVYADVGAMSIPETDPARLLKAFATSSENATVMGVNAASFDDDVDVKHLFTGKDLDGTTVGIAYIGSVCYQPKYAYSLTQVTTGGGAPYYFAHEIGHNLGARHDVAGWGSMSLMAPNILVGASFSPASLAQINEHLLYFGSCLELKSMTPSLVNSKLTLKVSRNRTMVKFTGVLLSASQEPIPGVAIKLVLGKRVVSRTTNSVGKFVFATPRNQIKKNGAVYASTVGGEARSQSLSSAKVLAG